MVLLASLCNSRPIDTYTHTQKLLPSNGITVCIVALAFSPLNYSPLYSHLGCFKFLIINEAAMIPFVQPSLCMGVCSTAGSQKSEFVELGGWHVKIFNSYCQLSSKKHSLNSAVTNSVWQCSLLHIFTNTECYSCFRCLIISWMLKSILLILICIYFINNEVGYLFKSLLIVFIWWVYV